MPVRTGTGTTLVLGTTDYDVEEISYSQGEMTVPKIDVTHMASTAREYMPGDLPDFGDMTVSVHIDPDKLDTFKTALGLSQTCTVTFNTVTGETSGATMSGTAFITGHSFEVPLEDKMSGTVTIAWADDVTFADAT